MLPRYLIPALHDFGEILKGRLITPFELHDAARKSLHFVGYEGMSMIAVSGLDMAAWDALAKAAGMPLCVLLGGSVGPVERSLYERANGYTYDAVKIFMPAGAKKPVYAPYVEHMPRDVTAGIFWLKNRDPDVRRGVDLRFQQAFRSAINLPV
jgi:L-alanine-DL-glutamate epimerase-like enolase superfamily enzyme